MRCANCETRASRVKTTKMVIWTVLCYILIANLLVPAALATQPAQLSEISKTPRYARIIIYEVSLTISPAGLTDCYSRVRLADSTDTATITIELQQKNGSTWSNLKSWSISGSDVVSIDKERYVSPGYTYRVYSTVQVYNSSGKLMETATLTSKTADY